MTPRTRIVGLFIGPLAALLVMGLLPEQYVDGEGQLATLSYAARVAAATAVWMATWWITEAISVYATALLPLAIFPVSGAATIRDTAAAYGHEVIFLFLGGFILALALERCGLHRRFALTVLKAVGTRPARIVAAFMGVAAFLSMWVTNTATTIMLLPVALSITALIDDQYEETSRPNHFTVCLLLAIAYAATIGGIGTIIGTAPNVFIVSFVDAQMDVQISFARWMTFAVPLVVILLPVVWLLLCKLIYPLPAKPVAGVAKILDRLHDDLGRLSRAERLTLLIFVLTATAWVTRPALVTMTIGEFRPFAGLTDAGIAVISALVLFVTPADLARREFLMDWSTAVKLPWGLLILFGGGLSLAGTLDNSGFSAYLGAQAVALSPLPVLATVAIVTGMMIFLTELTSNTATTATLIPILYAVAIGLDIDPLALILPAGIAASCAFMLPVATPPNAIVFGSGHVTIPQMSRAGFWLNLISIVLIPVVAWLLILPMLGVRL